ncbi:MAG: hypothetical protein DHS80DRAFT_22911 [Piptocephalis tieghemiana]|nr:MAG: hypothetical protein DHS80DRAFT_22911 [Piptocephalis tieghemiana]
MEKYSQWRDPGTGIQPFLPPVPSRTATQGPGYLARRYLLGPILCILRLILLLVPLLLFGLTELLIFIIPVPVLQRAIHRPLTAVTARLTLLLAGFWSIPSRIVTLRKGRSIAKKVEPIRSGDLLITNHTSYVDILYLMFRALGIPSRYDPVFTRCYTDSPKVSLVSPWEAMRTCGQVYEKTPATAMTLEEACSMARRKHQGPVVVFPEGTTSNGRALLAFTQVLSGVQGAEGLGEGKGKVGVHALILRYTYTITCPSYTVGNMALHALHILTQSVNRLSVHRVASQDIVEIDREKCEGGFGEEIAKVMGGTGRLRRCGLGPWEKGTFLSFYHSQSKASSK